MAVAHADVADDEGVIRQAQPGLIGQHQRLHAERGENGVFDRLEIIIAVAVVAVFFDEFFLLPDGLAVVPGGHFIAENGF